MSPQKIKSQKKTKGKPVFIVGSPRSGTSILTWCLGQHPNLLPLPETHWIARFTLQMRQLYGFGTINGRFSHIGALDWTEQEFYEALGHAIDQFVVDTREPRLRFIRKLSAKKQGLSDAQIAELEQNGALSPDPALVSAKNYQVVRSPDDPKDRWVDGTPENTFYMYSLSLLFPCARFIHLLREPNEVVQSLMNFSQAGSAGNDYAEGEAYSKWHQAVDFAFKGECALGKEKVLRISYAELVQSPEANLRNCLEFLGEDFSIDCLLPMREKINSSKVVKANSQFEPKTQIGEVANEFYRKILDFLPGVPDIKALDELALHYEKYADHINVR